MVLQALCIDYSELHTRFSRYDMKFSFLYRVQFSSAQPFLFVSYLSSHIAVCIVQWFLKF